MRLAQTAGWSRHDIRSMTPPEFDAYLKLSVAEPSTTDMLRSLLR